MTQTVQTKKHEATLILDTRGSEAAIDVVVEELRKAVAETGATSVTAEVLGRRDFVRVTDRKHPGDYYVKIAFEGPLNSAVLLREKFKLEKRVKRLLVELAK